MASPVADLEAGLSYMQSLKPPGVSGTRIASLTALCVDNVQSESVLIQKIYTHFKKAPGTHKLGVLYVVDSVTRRWIEQAKQSGQQINSSAPDGTYAAGVHRVTELIPVLMNDIVQTAPSEQKEKIRKLVDIWDKGQTFPAPMVESFKQKLQASVQPQESTTPPGSPPPGPGLPGLGEIKPTSQAPPNAILAALSNLARQHPASTAPASTSAPANAYSIPPTQPYTQTQSQTPVSFPPVPPPVSIPGMPFPFPQLGQAPAVNPSSQPPSFPGITPGMPPPVVPPPVSGAMDTNLQQQVMLIKLLADQGVPLDKIPAIVAAMQNNQAPSVPAAAPPVSAPQGPAATYGQGTWGPDRQARSPERYRNRSRSRSPGRQWDSQRSPRGPRNGHGSSSDRRSPDQGRGQHGRDNYRQRSPPGRHGRSPSPHRNSQSGPSTEKWVDYDRSIPQGSIKVLSRTLFVGGVTVPESELRSIFSRHGTVQTCIVNKDKRHAFVKMVNRRDAVAAKEANETGPFRTRWGVGFGPRDCSDYQTGVSIIPIARLTEADRKWMLTAEYGGSGGRPIESGLVVEEPDIEIGAGVSSKAISRRMQTDKSGRHGPKSSHDDQEDDGQRWRRNRDGRRDDRDNPNHMPPGQGAGSNFPFGIPTGANGMPMFPPGFSFPAPPGQ
ncbi:uncharacterized protein B0I36DRAFT_12036 [Microdochium trichocladiopsis]|uniref:Rpb7-binding protein seb1 n=1 Tax=Microdochium trichocladiopsis TaxID=1682393 RepID=A0A9P8YHT4_9PEZI|nr:uncharacterized protein B0I36DRAFT_12036 [Microdochium trichocladiopsis]KAH7040535.1 hypothetical protein B0I36DRAFT_12036 [Microdochium trichocladiopsis]